MSEFRFSLTVRNGEAAFRALARLTLLESRPAGSLPGYRWLQEQGTDQSNDACR